MGYGRRRSVLVWMVLIACGGCVGSPGYKDPAEAAAVLSALRQRYEFPVRSKTDPSQPAVYTRPAARETIVSVIGIVERAGQDRLIAVLGDIRATVANKAILVDFYPEERLEMFTDPVGVIHTYRVYRGDLRSVRIE